MKYVIALVLLASQLAFAGLPPTTSKGAGDSTFKTTFNYDFGSIILSHSGTTVTVGTIPASMLALAATAPITLTNGTIAIPVATAGANGYLSSGNFSIFNGKQNPIGSTAPITITSGTLVAIPASTNSVDGYLSSADHTLFNAKQNPLIFSSPLALSGTTASLNILAPLTTTSGSLSIPVSTNSVDGYLSAADHTIFNNKLSTAVTSLVQGSGISLNPSTISTVGTISANVTATAPVLSTGSVISLGTVGAANGGIGLTSAIASGNFLMSNGSTYSAGSIAVGSNLLLSNSGNVFTISHGTTSVAQGGTGLATAIATGNFLWSNGSAYSAGTIAQGSGITVSQDGSGKYTISATAASGFTVDTISASGNYIIPAGLSSVILVGCGGGGGGSGGGPVAGGAPAAGGKGGDAGEVKMSVITVTPNATLAVVIGSGGVAGAANGAGGNGSNSTFGGITFKGGHGGLAVYDGAQVAMYQLNARGGFGQTTSGVNSSNGDDSGYSIGGLAGTNGVVVGTGDGGAGGGGGSGFGVGGTGALFKAVGLGGGGNAGADASANTCGGGGGGGGHNAAGGGSGIGGAGGSGKILVVY